MLVENVTMLGHKDHGKSTLIGSVLMLTNSVSNTRIEEAKKYSEKLGKPFEPAFILDSLEEEREGGLTIDSTRAEAKYKDLAFEFIDVPGHEELIKNMMSGASFAETAILLASAKPGEGIREQTKRHVFVAKMLGIENIIVAVNKMDTINYDENIYNKIAESIGKFLSNIKFDGGVRYVPISAYKGENIIRRSDNMKWYKGMPLLEELYRMIKGAGKTDKNRFNKLRAVVQGFIDNDNKKLIGAKVLSGKIEKGKIMLFPGNIERHAKKIILKGRAVAKAGEGSSVAIEIDKEVKDPRGLVIAKKGEEPIVANKLNALIFTTAKLTPGSKVVIKILGNEVKCNKLKIIKQIDTTTGALSKKRLIESLNAGILELELESDIAFERYSVLKSMGRFSFYIENKFGGVGIVE
jgi:GTPases - Sulfate adenylate transferase subunit 1